MYNKGDITMKKENMYVPSGLKTRDGKDIMCYTAEFYVKNKDKIDRIIKRCEEILMEDAENEESGNAQDNVGASKQDNTNILKENSEKYNEEIHINKKHDKLFKEILSDKKEAVKFINYYLNLNLVENDIEKYEKEFRTGKFYNIEADVVYKIKDRNIFILIEHQSSVDLKMAYRIKCYKNAIIDESINKKKLREKNYKIPKVIAIVLYTGRRKWQNLLISDIEEKVKGYVEPENEYTLVDSNKFSREELLEDTLMTSKAMLIEKSKNTEELYKNIEDVIKNQKEKNDLNNIQLEKLVQYELAETKDENMIREFIEKIRNAKGEDEIMTNASRILNKEIRKQRKEGIAEGIAIGRTEGIAIGESKGKSVGIALGKSVGRSEGIALIAKRLKGKMHIKDISQITGLSESEINEL